MKIEKLSKDPERWIASGEIQYGLTDITIMTGGDTREEARKNWEAKADWTLEYLKKQEEMAEEIKNSYNEMLTCYQCGLKVQWLAPDSRCGKCTRFTPEEVKGSIH